jgi:hypothetical protein
MTGIERQAVFYRGYLIDDRSLAPLTTALTTIVALWLLVYLIGAVCLPAKPGTVGLTAQASTLAFRPLTP